MKSVLIIASYRSGSTWLGEILGESLRAQLDFEPFEPSWNHSVKNLRLRNRYLKPEGNYPAEHVCIEKIVKGKFNLPVKTLSKNPLRLYRYKWWRRRLCIKAIQAHLLIPYLKKQFGTKIVYMKRHPCAIIESLHRQQWGHSDLPEFLDGRNDALWKDYPKLWAAVEESLRLLNQPLSVDESDISNQERCIRVAIRWHIENNYLLHYHRDALDMIVDYETLYESPEGVLKSAIDLVGWSGCNIPRNVRKASRSTSKASPLQSGLACDSAWQRRLPSEHKDAIFKITEIFEDARPLT